MNLIPGRYADGVVHLPGGNHYPVPDSWRTALDGGLRTDHVLVGFRPEAAEISSTGALAAEVYEDDLHGAYTMVHLSLDRDLPTESVIHIRADRNIYCPVGEVTRFDLNPDMVRFFDPHTEMAVQGVIGNRYSD
jgi:hypothetical protein